MSYFSALNYSLGEEDSSLEYGVLNARPGESVLAVAGSGSRVIPLLACQPKRLICVDVSKWQLALTALRLSALHMLDRNEYVEFLGYKEGMDASRRRALFGSLKIDDAHRQNVLAVLEHVQWSAPLYVGRFERMLRQLRSINSVITGRRGTGIFECKTLQDQRDYLERHFPKGRWSLVVNMLGNGAVLNRLLYKGEFPENNTGVSTSKFYKRIFDDLLATRLARNSFFMQMLFFGKIAFEEGYCAEARPDIYEKARAALINCDVTLKLRDAIDPFEDKHEKVDFVSLSDVPSFLQDDPAARVLQVFKPHLNDHGTVVYRSHLRYIKPFSEGFAELTARFAPEIREETTGLWRFSIFGKEPVNV